MRRRARGVEIRVMVFPRDPNPYQELLRDELADIGVEWRYVGDPTPSQTLNILLLPAAILAGRARGFRIFHLHWVYPFALPWGRGTRLPQAVALLAFRALLLTLRSSGVKLIWTVHNVVPNTPVFRDDVSARRRLVRAADAVIAHSTAAVESLSATVGVEPRSVTIAPHGAYPVDPATEPEDGAPLSLLFFGNIAPYKGLEDLLDAFATFSRDHVAVLRVRGRCGDPRLAADLERRARELGSNVDVVIGRVAEGDLRAVFDGVSATVLPYRRATTSGVAMLSLSFGVPIVVPDIDAFAGIADDAAYRYDAAGDLVSALCEVAASSIEERQASRKAALSAAREASWTTAADMTAATYASALGFSR